MERLKLEIVDGIQALRKNNINVNGWMATIYVPAGKKQEMLDWWKTHSVIPQETLDAGCIIVEGVTLEIRESRGLVMVDTRGEPGLQVRASSLTGSQYMII